VLYQMMLFSVTLTAVIITVRCGLLLQTELRSLAVGHVREPRKNGLTEKCAWVGDSGGPKGPCIE